MNGPIDTPSQPNPLTAFGLEKNPVLNTFSGFLLRLDAIFKKPKEILDCSFQRMGSIDDEILKYARDVELELLRISRSPSSAFDQFYANILDSGDVRMAFNLIMEDLVDRRNHTPEKVRGDIDDTIGKLRMFMRHTLRDLILWTLDFPLDKQSQLYVRLFAFELGKEIRQTHRLLEMIHHLQQQLRRVKMVPETFEKLSGMFAEGKRVSEENWLRLKRVIDSVCQHFQYLRTEKKRLMRATDFFELDRKASLIEKFSGELLEKYEPILKQGTFYAQSECDELSGLCRRIEETLSDLFNFLDFLDYAIHRRECLSYEEELKKMTAPLSP